MAKYSFIIPVYNVEKWLKQCIDSILCQTFEDYEIILVDDGSTDSSGKLCDHFAKQYYNIKVVHQKNGGLSMARNTGIKIADSEFIIFLDSDDYWNDSEGLQKLDKLTSPDVDIIAFSSLNYYEDAKTFSEDRYDYPEKLNHMTPEQCLDYMIKNDRFNVSACKKVFKKSFFVNNKLYYKPGIKSEDIEQGFRMANCLPTYRFLNEKLYVYRHRSNSITTTIDEKHILDYFKTIVTYSNFKYRNENVRELLLSYLGYQYALLLAYTTNTQIKKKEAVLQKLKNYLYLLSYSGYPRTEKIYKLYKRSGFTITRYALGFYLRSK